MSTATLVTGGSGFVGRALVEELLARGVRQVRILDIEAPPKDLAERVEFIHGSILDERVLRRAASGAGRVYHLAGTPELWLPDKRAFATINVEGTRRVLEAARRAGAERVVYTSTESIIIGTRRDAAIADETLRATLEDMPGPYCRSKFLAEREARRAAAEGLPVVIVNPSLPIGAGDERLTPPTRMLLGYLNERFPAYLDCDLNLIHVRDVAVGHILAAERGMPGERYILGGENWRLSQLLAELETITGIAMPRMRVPHALALGYGVVSEVVADYITRRPPSAPLTGVRLAGRPMRFNNGRARAELGLRLMPISDALREAVDWLAERGLMERPVPKAAWPTDGLHHRGPGG